jgi:uncharacterized membrane protein YedE/YeeE
MRDLVLVLGLGFGFGWLLHKAGLTHAATIVNVYRLRDATVVRFMMAALVVGAVGIQLLVDLGLSPGVPVPPTRGLANLLGGAVFGVGMATAGFCPGTIVAQAGEGHLDAWIAGFAGLIAGAILFGLLQPVIMPALGGVASIGRVTAAQLLGASPWLVLIVFAELVVLVLALIRR